MDSILENELLDSKGSYTAKLFNVEILEGHSGEAGYFNRKNSHVEAPINFHGWDGITISLWVKPERSDIDDLFAILDNGHTAKTDFVIQSADSKVGKWAWYCNGIIFFYCSP